MNEDSYAGRTLGPFRIGEKLGKGGMGTVYRATHTTLEREVALKILPERSPEEADDFEARFLLEARASAKINHPNIVQVYDAGDVDGVSYISMELIEGPSLRELQAGAGQFTALQAVDIALQASTGLEGASEKGIIHGDVKPDNLLITVRGEVKVSDFGLAKMHDAARNRSDEEFFAGTPAYMSPEQGVGEATDFRSDIYSLGVTLFEMVTGRKPFSAPSSVGLLVMHFSAPIPSPATLRPDLAPEFCAVNLKMMEKNPDERFQSYDELIEALTALKENLESQSSTVSRGRKSKSLVEFLSELDQERKVKESAQDDETRRLPNPPIPAELKPALLRLKRGSTRRTLPKTLPTPASAAPPKHAAHWWLSPASAAVLLVLGTAIIAVAAWTGGFRKSGNGPEEPADSTFLATADPGDRKPAPEPGDGKNPAGEPSTPTEPVPDVPEPGPADPARARDDKAKRDLYRVLRETESLEEKERYDQALSRLASGLPEGLGDVGDENVHSRLAVAKGQVKLKLAGLEERTGCIRKALDLALSCWFLRDSFPRLKAYIDRMKAKRDILTRFPPGPLWHKERKQDVMMKVLYGKEVTDEERQFYLHFPEWDRALDPAGCGLDAKTSTGDVPEILMKYPPGREWNAKRKEHIVHKMLSREGPTEEEREFYLRYREWEKAIAEFENPSD